VCDEILLLATCSVSSIIALDRSAHHFGTYATAPYPMARVMKVVKCILLMVVLSYSLKSKRCRRICPEISCEIEGITACINMSGYLSTFNLAL
jgi:hypothetical protein